MCIACDLEVDFEELAEFVAGSGAMEVECLTPIMDELLPRIPYRLRQRQTVMTYDFDREGQPGFPPAAVLSDRNFIYSDHLDCDADAFVENRELPGDVRGDLPVLRGLPGEQPLPGLVCGHLCPHQKGGELPLRPLPGGGAGLHRRGVQHLAGVGDDQLGGHPAGLAGAGLARQCIRRCLEYVRYLDCTPYLTAAEPDLVDYYTGLGFTPCAERCSAIYWPQR